MIRFDALSKADCEQIRLWRNEDIAGARTPYLLTELQQERFYEDIVNNRESLHRYWAVNRETNEIDTMATRLYPLVGIAGLTNIEWENGRAEIALMIGNPYRGKGYGTEALNLLIDWGFGRMRLHSIYGVVYKCNPYLAWWEQLITEGDWYATTLPQAKWWDEKFHDAVHFTIMEEDL